MAVLLSIARLVVVALLAFAHSASASITIGDIGVFKPTIAPAPTGVKFDAFDTSNDEGYDDWEDLAYSWDFGDPHAPTLTHGVRAGQSSNTQCCTQNAGHVYTRAGTYTVTLTVRTPRGTEARKTTTVTIDTDAVAGWTGTNIVCISNDSDLTWCPDGGVGHTTRKSITGDVKSVIDDYTGRPNRKILLECGASYTWSGGAIDLSSDGPGILSCTGGTGDKATINGTSSPIAKWSTGNGDNWRFTNLNFESGASDYRDIVFFASTSAKGVRDLTFYNLEFDGFGVLWRAEAGIDHQPSNVAWVDFWVHDNQATDSGNGTYGMWMYFNDSFIRDCHFGPNLNYHHIRTHGADRIILSDCDLNNSGAHQTMIKYSGGDPAGNHSDHDTVSWNRFIKDAMGGGALSVNPEAPGYNQLTEDMIVEYNLVDMKRTHGGAFTGLRFAAMDVVVRNNVCMGIEGRYWSNCIQMATEACSGGGKRCGAGYKILNNTCYTDVAGSEPMVCVDWSGDTTAPSPIVRNNFSYKKTGTGTSVFNAGAGATEEACGNVENLAGRFPFAELTPTGFFDFSLAASDTLARGRGCASDESIIDGRRAIRPVGGRWDAGAFEQGAKVWQGATTPPRAPLQRTPDE